MAAQSLLLAGRLLAQRTLLAGAATVAAPQLLGALQHTSCATGWLARGNILGTAHFSSGSSNSDDKNRKRGGLSFHEKKSKALQAVQPVEGTATAVGYGSQPEASHETALTPVQANETRASLEQVRVPCMCTASAL